MVALKIITLGVLASFIWMSLLWWISEKIKNAALVDVGWGISVLLYCTIYFFGTNGLQGKEFLALFAPSNRFQQPLDMSALPVLRTQRKNISKYHHVPRQASRPMDHTTIFRE